MTKLTKKSKELATKIIDQRGVWSKQFSDAIGEEVDVLDLTETLGMVWGTSQIRQDPKNDDELGKLHTETKEEVRARAIDELAGTLDDGTLVLSDTWEEDNLK